MPRQLEARLAADASAAARDHRDAPAELTDLLEPVTTPDSATEDGG
ncbi:MAG: hypothetical protein ACRDOB_19985 [Streptosporangiaceae bacterium]